MTKKSLYSNTWVPKASILCWCIGEHSKYLEHLQISPGFYFQLESFPVPVPIPATSELALMACFNLEETSHLTAGKREYSGKNAIDSPLFFSKVWLLFKHKHFSDCHIPLINFQSTEMAVFANSVYCYNFLSQERICQLPHMATAIQTWEYSYSKYFPPTAIEMSI